MATVSNWQISIAGGPLQQLIGLGWSDFRVEIINMQTSTCVFIIQTASITDACPVSEGQSFVLYNNTTIHFVGKITNISMLGKAKEILWHVTVSNAWWYLERIVYQQPTVGKIKVGSSWITTLQMSSRVVLGQDLWGRNLTIQGQIANILAYAGAYGSGGLTVGNLNYYASAVMPLQEAKDITCAEALRRCLLWSPNAVVSFAYGTGTPVMDAVPRSNLPAGTLDLNDSAKVFEIDEITPRYDLNVPGVSLTFVTYTQDAASPAGDGAWHPIYTTQNAGVPFADGSIFGTIELGNPGQYTAEQVPGGLALQYYVALQGQKWSGRLTIKEQECSAAIRLGQAINILNGQSAWASMNGVVQQIHEDIDAGLTTIIFGPPAHLGPQDFAAMMMLLRNIPPPGGVAGTNNNGTTGAGTASSSLIAGLPAIPGITSGGAAPNPAWQPPWTPVGTGGGDLVPNLNAGKIPPAGKSGALGNAAGGASAAASNGNVTLTLCDNSTVKVMLAK